MQVCTYMQVCKYASMHVYESMQVCTYMQVCKYASMLIYESMQVCHPNSAELTGTFYYKFQFCFLSTLKLYVLLLCKVLHHTN